MKKTLTLFLTAIWALQVSAQDVVKTGINVGPLPAVGYSSDLGWHYGALADIFWYGDGSKYPEYVWKANVETSWYSKGNSVYRAFFDSKYLVPGIRLSAEVVYLGNKTTTIEEDNGDKLITEVDSDREVTTATRITNTSPTVKTITTTITPDNGDYYWTKVEVITTTISGKTITKTTTKSPKA